MTIPKFFGVNHSQDKDPNESWSAYWERHKTEKHSDNCPCDDCRKVRKPIKTVMEDAADLVQPVHELHQFLNVKGD